MTLRHGAATQRGSATVTPVAEGLIGPGFYPQPNEWTCGPFALKHALLALGRMVDVNQISATARTPSRPARCW